MDLQKTNLRSDLYECRRKNSFVSVADNNSYGQLINAFSLIRTAAGFVPINYVSIVAESLLLRRYITACKH